MDRPEFAIGASVMLSELGRRSSRAPDRRGKVVGISRTGTACRVRWTNLRTADFVHVSFLQACGSGAAGAPTSPAAISRE